MTRYLDTHCHLDPRAYDDEAGVDATVARAVAGGVERMITIGSGYGTESAKEALATARRHPDRVWATVGVHPHDAREWTDEVAAHLAAWADHPRVVAMGEMGLDFHYDNSPRDVQREVLRRQIRLALELGLPMVIHDRESDGETLRILDEEQAFAGRGVLYHCFTGTVAQMEQIVERGGYVSISGIVTFKNAGQVRDVARNAPLDRLLVETDSPFLAPVPYRGKRNEPAHVVQVAARVAEERNMEVHELALATWQNACRFFGLPT